MLGHLDLDYASHLLYSTSLNPATVMIAVLYLERLKSLNIDFVHQNTPCDLFLISIVVASKFLFDQGEDEIIYNDEWARLVCMNLQDFTALELEFLQAINWSCYVDSDTFLKQLTKFEGLVSLNESIKRSPGMFHLTYNEIISCFEYITLHCNHKQKLFLNNLNIFVKAILLMSSAYIALIFATSLSLLLVTNHERSLVVSESSFEIPVHSLSNTTLEFKYSPQKNSLTMDDLFEDVVIGPNETTLEYYPSERSSRTNSHVFWKTMYLDEIRITHRQFEFPDNWRL